MTQADTLILVGAGHVHHRLLVGDRRWLRTAGRVVLISSSSFRYGGAATPMLAGTLDPDALKRSASRTAEAAGVAHINGRVVGIEPRSKRLWLASGESMRFAAISLNVGYARLAPQWSGWVSNDMPCLWSGTSIAELARLRQRLVAQPPGIAMAVLGGTQRALEIVAGMSAATDLPDMRITLYLPGRQLCAGLPRGIATRIAGLLGARGVDIVTQSEIGSLAPQSLLAGDGRRFRADHVVIADSPWSAPLIRAAGRPQDDRSGLTVDRRLSAVRGLDYLASGGCASLGGRVGLPPDDSAAQARVIAANLIARDSADAIERYRLPHSQGAIDLGCGAGAAWRAGWGWPTKGLPRTIVRARQEWIGAREPGRFR